MELVVTSVNVGLVGLVMPSSNVTILTNAPMLLIMNDMQTLDVITSKEDITTQVLKDMMAIVLTALISMPKIPIYLVVLTALVSMVGRVQEPLLVDDNCDDGNGFTCDCAAGSIGDGSTECKITCYYNNGYSGDGDTSIHVNVCFTCINN